MDVKHHVYLLTHKTHWSSCCTLTIVTRCNFCAAPVHGHRDVRPCPRPQSRYGVPCSCLSVIVIMLCTLCLPVVVIILCTPCIPVIVIMLCTQCLHVVVVTLCTSSSSACYVYDVSLSSLSCYVNCVHSHRHYIMYTVSPYHHYIIYTVSPCTPYLPVIML